MSTNSPGGKNAVVLLSGGIDSTTTLAVAKSLGYSCHALSFDYGQRHRVELDCAKRELARLKPKADRWDAFILMCHRLGVEFREVYENIERKFSK